MRMHEFPAVGLRAHTDRALKDNKEVLYGFSRCEPLRCSADPGRQIAAASWPMSKNPIKVLLLVEDNQGDARLLQEMLNERSLNGTEVSHVTP
jgi:hypothetical protein